MASRRPLTRAVALIATLFLLVPTTFAQSGPDRCPGPDGGLTGCSPTPEDEDVIGDIVAGGIVELLGRTISGGQLSASHLGAAGIRLQRHFPLRTWNGTFVGIGLRALPTLGPGSATSFDAASTQPHMELTTGYTVQMSEWLGDRPGWRRLGLSVEANAFIGASDRIRVALAPRFNVLETRDEALYVGVYVSQTALGGYESSGPSFGITLGISRVREMTQ